jgi:hypothetical protein
MGPRGSECGLALQTSLCWTVLPPSDGLNEQLKLNDAIAFFIYLNSLECMSEHHLSVPVGSSKRFTRRFYRICILNKYTYKKLFPQFGMSNLTSPGGNRVKASFPLPVG